VATILMLS